MKLYAQGPLVGVQVLEVCEGQAGPYCGAILSDLGAGVIKVEDREAIIQGSWAPSRTGSPPILSVITAARGALLSISARKRPGRSLRSWPQNATSS